MVQNKGLIFKSVPKGWPIEGEHIVIEDRPFDLDAEPPKDGITTKNYYISFDPYQRGRLRSAEVKSYAPAYPLGQAITNSGIARVLKSSNATYAAGDLIRATIPTEEYSALSGEQLRQITISKLDNPFHLDPRVFLGALGMPGLTAYSSFYKIGEPKRGETIFISSASGAVGQVVGQLAKHEGLTVIGSVGSDEKLAYIKGELGFHEGFNYKKEKPLEALKRLAPKGIDIYFENVGGETLDAALASMNDFGRIGSCPPVHHPLDLLPIDLSIHQSCFCSLAKCMTSGSSSRGTSLIASFHDSRLRYDLAIQRRQTGGRLRGEEPRHVRQQTPQDPRLHRLGPELRPRLLCRTPAPCAALDRRRDLHHARERDRGDR